MDIPVHHHTPGRIAQTIVLFLVLLGGLFSQLSAELHPGAIAFVGMNTDGNADQFAFVALQYLPAGEFIYFTDAGWDVEAEDFRPGEGLVGYTVPANGLSAGTVITIPLYAQLSSSGDQVIAYQLINGQKQPIAAINNYGSAFHPNAISEHTSAVPIGLAQGFTAVSVGNWDNLKYNGPFSGNKAQLLQAISDPQNWTGSSAYNQSFSGMSFSVTTTAPIITMGEVLYSEEGGGSINVNIFSDQAGSHTAQLVVVGGNAQNGSDYTTQSTVNIGFSGACRSTYSIPVLDDPDCEPLENIILRLQNASGAQILANDLEIFIADDDGTGFSVVQGFEASPQDNWNYTIVPLSYNSETGPDPASIYGQEQVWAPIKSFDAAYFAPEGTYFWGMQDLDNTVGGGAFDHVLTFDPVALTGISHAVLSFKYFTFNSTSSDELKYAVAYDNGTAWGSFTVLPHSTAAWNTVQVNVPSTATHVRLAIVGRETSGILCSGIDEVRVSGVQCNSSLSIVPGNLPASLCISEGSIAIPFSSTGNYSSGNTFTAELSDASGGFSTPVVLGSIALSGSDPSGLINGTVPQNTPPGTGYRIRITSSDPAFTGSDNGSDITLSSLTATLTPYTYSHGGSVSCPGSSDGSIDLQITSGSGPFTYSWTGPNGFTSANEDLAGLSAGSYSVTITDQSGCSITESVSLVDPVLSLSFTVDPVSCYAASDGAITSTAQGWSGPMSFSWTGPNGYTASGPVITGLGPGTYYLFVSDANGCSLNDSAIVTEPSGLSLGLSSPVLPCGHNTVCFNSADGSIDLTVTGGTPPYSYAWSGPGAFSFTAEDPSGLGAGTYSVQVTDLNGCVGTSAITLSEPPPLSATVEADSYACGFNVSCFGAADGVAHVVGESGGCPPYTYTWSNGASSSTSSGLSAGIPYDVTITDANGCAIIRSVTLSQPSQLIATPQVTEASCDASANGAIFFPVTGGCLPHQVSWTGPNGFVSTDQHPDSLFAGVYQYAVVDGNGCSISGNVIVNAANNLAASLGCCQDTVVCIGESVDIEVLLTGTGAHEVTWLQNGDTMSLIFPSGPTGTISVLILETTTIELISVSSTNSGCEGTVCGSVTIGANACGTPCEDICIKGGVISVEDQGACRTVTMEVACDSVCQVNASSCPGTRVVSFDHDPFGNPIPAGTVVGSQWASMGVSFTFVNNNPNKAPVGVIFDSGNPTGGDWDLGTPNQDFGGPGIGAGGEQGAAGENNTALGNLLILAENTTDSNNDGLIDNPDDEGAGGELQMNFAFPYYVESLSMVDLDNGNGLIRIHQTGNRVTDLNIPGLGDNAVSTIPIQMDSVVRIRVILPGSGGISALAYCPVSPGYMDISIPCGSVTSVTNDAGLPTEIISSDPVTGMTGIRIHGLPSDCIDSTGLGAFRITYESCSQESSCGAGFCLPLLAFNSNGCTQYEMATMGPVANLLPEPPSEDNSEGARLARIEAFPNPITSEGTLKLYLPEGGFAEVDLFNLAGQNVGAVFSGEVLAEEEKLVAFKVEELPSGVYLLRMTTHTGEVLTRRLVLNK